MAEGVVWACAGARKPALSCFLPISVALAVGSATGREPPTLSTAVEATTVATKKVSKLYTGGERMCALTGYRAAGVFFKRKPGKKAGLGGAFCARGGSSTFNRRAAMAARPAYTVGVGDDKLTVSKRRWWVCKRCRRSGLCLAGGWRRGWQAASVAPPTSARHAGDLASRFCPAPSWLQLSGTLYCVSGAGCCSSRRQTRCLAFLPRPFTSLPLPPPLFRPSRCLPRPCSLTPATPSSQS